jgi:tRNA modification GTPase
MTKAPPDTLVTILTPPGRGAVAVVSVRGPAATTLASRYFRRANGVLLEETPLRTIAFGRWSDRPDSDGPDSVGEEVVVTRRDGDWVEVHCHGGLVASDAIQRSLVRGGAIASDEAVWQMSVDEDPLIRAAWQAFAHAPTQRTAALLADQATGALRRTCQAMIELIRAGAIEEALARVHELLELAPCGLHLTTPWRIALVGPPNVGKSSLMNRLVGFDRAIVADRPGTTRDVVSATTAWDGWPLEFWDTAGIRESNDTLEIEGIARTHRHRRLADCQILVTDLTAPWSVADQQLLNSLNAPLIAHNKADIVTQSPDARPAGIQISAWTGAGIEHLLDRLIQQLVPRSPLPGQAIPFLPAIVERLEQVFDLLKQGHGSRAAELLRFDSVPSHESGPTDRQ